MKTKVKIKKIISNGKISAIIVYSQNSKSDDLHIFTKRKFLMNQLRKGIKDKEGDIVKPKDNPKKFFEALDYEFKNFPYCFVTPVVSYSL